MNRLTRTQLVALMAARDSGLVKTGSFWHSSAYIVDAESYRPDRVNVFTTETVMSLNNQGLITGGGKITEDGIAALTTGTKRAAADTVVAAVSIAAREAAGWLRKRPDNKKRPRNAQLGR